MRSTQLVASLLLLGCVAQARAQSSPPLEVSGTLQRDPLRVEGYRLVSLASSGLEPILQRAAQADGAVTLLLRPRVEEGLPLRGRQQDAELVAVQGRVVADIERVGPAGQREAVRAHTPVWITRARPRGGDELLQVHLGSVDGSPFQVAGSLVRVGDDATGRVIGRMLAPVFASTSSARQARTFHPDASCWRGEVVTLSPPPPWTAAAARLEGQAMVRMGPGMWKHRQMDWAPDLLSLAIRFKGRGAVLDARPAAGDQDLFVSSDAERFQDFFNPALLVGAEEHDYFANTYYPAQPFQLESAGKRVWLRVVPVGYRPELEPDDQPGREAKLREAVQTGHARFRIEVQEQAGAVTRFLELDRDASSGLRIPNPVRRWFAHDWIPLAELRLTAPLELDQEQMRYYPDLAGRGLRPVGTVASIRPAVYAASQGARPGSAEERAQAESKGINARLGGN